MNVLGGAPYGYRYVKKNEATDACYIVDEAQAAVVREVFEWYTVEGLSIGAIARRLNDRGVPTRFGKSRCSKGCWSAGSVVTLCIALRHGRPNAKPSIIAVWARMDIGI